MKIETKEFLKACTIIIRTAPPKTSTFRGGVLFEQDGTNLILYSTNKFVLGIYRIPLILEGEKFSKWISVPDFKDMVSFVKKHKKEEYVEIASEGVDLTFTIGDVKRFFVNQNVQMDLKSIISKERDYEIEVEAKDLSYLLDATKVCSGRFAKRVELYFEQLKGRAELHNLTGDFDQKADWEPRMIAKIGLDLKRPAVRIWDQHFNIDHLSLLFKTVKKGVLKIEFINYGDVVPTIFSQGAYAFVIMPLIREER